MAFRRARTANATVTVIVFMTTAAATTAAAGGTFAVVTWTEGALTRAATTSYRYLYIIIYKKEYYEMIY